MAKDTEKLIRQLSLISYLMAERRPVTALEIRRDVEGYSTMNEDAFARRFYADRSELDSLGIALTVERPVDGVAEQENYSLRPENFHLPAIAFTDAELAALQTALSLLDGEFAYAEPLRLALQQISWGRANPLRAPEQRGVALGITASAGGHDLSQRLAKIETAIFRNKTITFDYYTMARDATGTRKVDPYHLLFQGGQFYLLGHSHERGALRVFRLSRIRGKVAYATKAEHDFKGRPEGFDPRAYANRADWQFGDADGTAEIQISERIAWQIERHFGRFGEVRPRAPRRRRHRLRDAATPTAASSPRGCCASASTPACSARRSSSARSPSASSCSTSATARADGSRRRRARRAGRAGGARRRRRRGQRRTRRARGGDPARALRAPRDARVDPHPGRPRRRAPAGGRGLRADADLRRRAARGHQRPQRRELRRRLLRPVRGDRRRRRDRGRPRALLRQLRPPGAAAAGRGEGARRRDRPHRRAPARGLAAVVAREDRRRARRRPDGPGPARRRAPAATTRASRASPPRRSSERRLLRLDYYKPNEDEFSARVVEPYALVNGREGWYVACYDPDRGDVRHFRLDRIRHAEVADDDVRAAPRGRPGGRGRRAGCAPARSRPRASRASGSRPSARAGRARSAASHQELADGSVIVELTFKGTDFLVRDVLAEAGDAAVLEPAGRARGRARRRARLRSPALR